VKLVASPVYRKQGRNVNATRLASPSPVATCVAVLLLTSVVSEHTSDAVAAGPQDYCVAFAGHLANNRTGSVPDGKQPRDEKWQGVYDKAFIACMKDYSEPAKASAPESAGPRDSGGNRKAHEAKVHSPRHHSVKRAHSHRTTHSLRVQSRSIRSSQTPTAISVSPPSNPGRAICRRAKANSKGAFKITNC
jgi:hypothetical protein